MNPIDYDEARTQWASATMRRGVMNSEWDINNPDFMFCKLHLKSVPIVNSVFDGPSLEECQMCRPNELQIQPTGLSIAELREQWNTAYADALNKSDNYYKQHSKALKELCAWLSYEKACWDQGVQFRNQLVPKEVKQTLQVSLNRASAFLRIRPQIHCITDAFHTFCI